MIYWGLVAKLNFFLQLNGKIILLILIFLVLFSLFFLKNYTEKANMNINDNIENINDKTNNDIINPKFSLNSNKEIIEVTAESGNFISSDLIQLNKNVKFKSKKFEIFSNKVLVNNKTQTAESNTDAKFLSKNTEILSEGFKINEKGNKIQFNGKTKIILEEWKNFFYFY